MPLFTKLFGDANSKYIKLLEHQVAEINAVEATISQLSDDELRAKTAEFRERVNQAYIKSASAIQALERQIRDTVGDEEKLRLKGELNIVRKQPLNEILPEAFAVVREAARRSMGQRHYDVQLMGGIALHEGQVAEMRTGEGKTLTSTLAVYVNALTGRGVHVVTVNDYLARRDAVWMGQVYHMLGLSIGVIVHDASYLYDPTATTAGEDEIRDQGVKVEMDYLRETDRKQAYLADITYGTNNEFGFDYLRDNMATSLEQRVQRELNYAIIDEVDSILIDEARTPLIISAADDRPTDRYYMFAQLVQTLDEHKHYTIDEKLKAVSLTEEGIAKVEKALGVENIYVEQGIQTVHHIEQALKAKTLYLKDKDYTVKDGQVIIVDEFTGRMLPGRRYSEGLHQAIEAKEGVEIQRESRTMATITFQNYFRLYEKIAGMTGTAETEAEELNKIYNLEVTTIPTNKPMVRKDLQDRIYKTEEGKFKAVVQEIKQRNTSGQPVLVGTVSIEKNEQLARLLELEGLQFNILNAKHHEREAEVIAQAGAKGAITIATNMAGRGVDIKLGGLPSSPDKANEIIGLGGLHIIGTERHESRRIDNQLRGRAGRQGEPGSSQFYVSLEDDLMRIFGAERVKTLMRSWPDDMPIENNMISKSIESAQKRVEGHNFDIRKHLVEYDDVTNKQRMYVYRRRDQILAYGKEQSDELIKLAHDEVAEEVENVVGYHTQSASIADWLQGGFGEALKALVGNVAQGLITDLESEKQSHQPDEVRNRLLEKAKEAASKKLDELIHQLAQALKNDQQPEPAKEVIKVLYLRSMDMLWVDHLETIQHLRTGIGLRGYGQRDPLVEYKRESKELFSRLLADIRRQFVFSLMNIGIGQPTPVQHASQPVRVVERKASVQSYTGEEQSNEKIENVSSKPKDESGEKIGRNDPCPCGSGKKYKKCHGV